MTVTVGNGRTIRFGVSIVSVTVCLSTRASRRLWVDVHAHELELESIEVGDVRDEVHEVRKLGLR
jgi:hypothetical protein